MSMFRKSIASVFSGSAKAFRRFPAVMAMAIAFTLIIIIKIESNSRGIEGNAFLLDCLQWALALGSLFSLAAITFTRTRSKGSFYFIMANLAGLAVALLAYILLYFFAGVERPYVSGLSLSDLAVSRMVVASAISLIAFISAAAYPPEISDFSRSFFMTMKAFFVALVYGLVIGGGTSAVAAAIEALLFPAMSSTVYAYLSTLAGFLAFTIFVGYFPEFDPAAKDPKRSETQDQPRFIEILCEYILIPIMLAFTLVLLAWVIRILLPGDAPLVDFLSGTIGSYALVTIWLHLMVTHYDSKLATFYRRVAPFALLVIIAFSLGSLTGQIREDGLTPEYYWFILIATFSAVSALLLIVIRKRAHLFMALLASILAVVAVLPQVGAVELPVQSQINRLEAILTEEGLLTNGELKPATEEPSSETRADITNAVNYLAWTDYQDLPAWFDRRMIEEDVFSRSFGFSMTDFPNGSGPDYLATSLLLPGLALDISDYSFALQLEGNDREEPGNTSLIGEVQGRAGEYRIVWETAESALPRLTVSLNETELFNQDIQAYVDQILEDFPLSVASGWQPTVEDMTYLIDTPEVDLLLLFNSIMISQEPGAEQLTYWFDLQQIFLSED